MHISHLDIHSSLQFTACTCTTHINTVTCTGIIKLKWKAKLHLWSYHYTRRKNHLIPLQNHLNGISYCQNLWWKLLMKNRSIRPELIGIFQWHHTYVIWFHVHVYTYSCMHTDSCMSVYVCILFIYLHRNTHSNPYVWLELSMHA